MLYDCEPKCFDLVNPTSGFTLREFMEQELFKNWRLMGVWNSRPGLYTTSHESASWCDGHLAPPSWWYDMREFGGDSYARHLGMDSWAVSENLQWVTFICSRVSALYISTAHVFVGGRENLIPFAERAGFDFDLVLQREVEKKQAWQLI